MFSGPCHPASQILLDNANPRANGTLRYEDPLPSRRAGFAPLPYPARPVTDTASSRVTTVPTLFTAR